MHVPHRQHVCGVLHYQEELEHRRIFSGVTVKQKDEILCCFRTQMVMTYCRFEHGVFGHTLGQSEQS